MTGSTRKSHKVVRDRLERKIDMKFLKFIFEMLVVGVVMYLPILYMMYDGFGKGL